MKSNQIEEAKGIELNQIEVHPPTEYDPLGVERQSSEENLRI